MPPSPTLRYQTEWPSTGIVPSSACNAGLRPPYPCLRAPAIGETDRQVGERRRRERLVAMRFGHQLVGAIGSERVGPDPALQRLEDPVVLDLVLFIQLALGVLVGLRRRGRD